MELLIIVLFIAALVLAGAASVVAVLRDGRGHTPEVRSIPPWKAGDLPSEPYATARH